MARTTLFLLMALLFAPQFAVSAQIPSAAELTQRIEALAAQREEDIPIRRQQARRVESDLSRFIIHQLETRPSIAQCDLQDQLRKLFGTEHPLECQRDDPDSGGAPQVFTTTEAALRRQVVVTYALSLGCMGKGCTVPVFENYVYEHGKAQRTTRLDSMLNGYLTRRELLAWYPDEEQYWVLLSAMMSGSSGRLLGRQAFLLQIGIDSVKIRWQTPILGNLNVHAHQMALRWEVDYVDDSLYPNGPDKQVLDVYQLNYASQTFRRIIHYHEK
jgi:hypothetical protein